MDMNCYEYIYVCFIMAALPKPYLSCGYKFIIFSITMVAHECFKLTVPFTKPTIISSYQIHHHNSYQTPPSTLVAPLFNPFLETITSTSLHHRVQI